MAKSDPKIVISLLIAKVKSKSLIDTVEDDEPTRECLCSEESWEETSSIPGRGHFRERNQRTGRNGRHGHAQAGLHRHRSQQNQHGRYSKLLLDPM